MKQKENCTLNYLLPQRFVDSTEEESLPLELHFQQPRAIIIAKQSPY